ncbi:MAG: hypothetical protein QG670_2148 [Thermoproteota archaeon]|nr:hypothetical protein [Thermoproteota archaeon]
MKTQELANLASTLTILGIVFTSDQFIGYSFIGAGVLLSIVSGIKAKKKELKIPARRKSSWIFG